MSKQLYSQRCILKITSSRLKEDGVIKLYPQALRESNDLISLGDSQILRFIRDITGMNHTEQEIKQIKNKIKLKKKELSKNKAKKEVMRKQIKELYKKLDDMLFIKDYIAIVFENKGDFNKAVKKDGVIIDGIKYKRIVGTTGGVKNNTVMFCNEEVHSELNRRLENGRDKEFLIVPAKYEAYKSLATSVSTPVTMPNKILVIKDGETIIKDNVIKVFDDGKGGFDIDENFEYQVTKEFCDGCGMIRNDLADKWAIDLGLSKIDSEGNVVAKYTPSGFNTRYAFNKGMVFTFPFDEFARDVAKNNIVIDAWENEVDIRDVDLVLTTNMLKLWKAYDSIDDYLYNCNKNGYLFSVAKVIGETLENKRNTNYQYLQSYDFTDGDIEELASETVEDIKAAISGDYRKAILFSKGIHITDKNIEQSEYDFIRALTIDKRMIEDSFVKQRIYSMIEKRIQHAKKGVLSIDGNYSIISGDLYALCESMFGMEVKGLLGFGEFYNKHWLDKDVDEVVAFRSPMTNHNNIRKLKFIRNEFTEKWYRYMACVTIFNAWDTTCDAMNGW